MNRRAFFGFACGGVAAAPAALLGAQKPAKAETARLTIDIDVSDTGHLKAYVAEVVQEAQREAIRAFRNDHMTRG
jgi:gas vesicle protein